MVIQIIAAMITATPATVKILYRPVLAMKVAELWMVRMMPTVIGSISRPEFAADSPELICRNVGMKAIAENMPSPTAMPERRGDDEGAVAEQRHRDDRLGRPELDGHEGDDRDDEARRAATAPARSPSRRWPPKSVKKISDVVVADSARMPGVVDGRRAALARQGQREPADGERGDSDELPAR